MCKCAVSNRYRMSLLSVSWLFCWLKCSMFAALWPWKHMCVIMRGSLLQLCNLMDSLYNKWSMADILLVPMPHSPQPMISIVACICTACFLTCCPDLGPWHLVGTFWAVLTSVGKRNPLGPTFPVCACSKTELWSVLMWWVMLALARCPITLPVLMFLPRTRPWGLSGCGSTARYWSE